MKQYMKALGAFDRDLHKQVAKINRAERVTSEISNVSGLPPVWAGGPYTSEIVEVFGLTPIDEKSLPPCVKHLPGGGLYYIESADLTYVSEEKPSMTNRTGFGGFAGMIRQQLDGLKQEASSIQGEMSQALSEGQELAQVARKTVNDVKAEIAEAKAAFGQITNGGPSE